MKTKAEIYVAYTTVPTLEIGREIAKHLISQRLAACTQISESPVISCYIWKGEVNEDKEFVLTIKFPKANVDKVKEAVMLMHPYECPQWYAVEPSLISQKYAIWAERADGSCPYEI